MAGVEGPRDITDCPRCGSVCLGASLLPCGHVICRPCLAFLLNLDKLAATCPSCSDIILKQNHADDDDGRSVNLNVADVNFLSRAMDKIGRDDILNQLVVERITSGQILCCEEHPRKMAAAVCAECSSKPMCTSCSDAHKSRARTKSHFLQEMNPRQRPYFNPRTRTQPRSHQQHPNSGASSLLWDTPIPELPLENPTLDGAEVDENLQMKNENEVNLVQDLINGELKKCVEVGVKLLESETHISAVIAQLESRKRDMQIQHQLLMTYTSHLQSSASVTDVAQARRMLKRLRRVRADSQPIRVDSFETLTDAVENLQNNTEYEDLDETTNSDLTSSDHPEASVADPSTTKSWFLRRFQWPSDIFRQTTPENINLPSNEHQPSSLESEGHASENHQPNTGSSSTVSSRQNDNHEIISQITSRSGTEVLDSFAAGARPLTRSVNTKPPDAHVSSFDANNRSVALLPVSTKNLHSFRTPKKERFHLRNLKKSQKAPNNTKNKKRTPSSNEPFTRASDTGYNTINMQDKLHVGQFFCKLVFVIIISAIFILFASSKSKRTEISPVPNFVTKENDYPGWTLHHRRGLSVPWTPAKPVL